MGPGWQHRLSRASAWVPQGLCPSSQLPLWGAMQEKCKAGLGRPVGPQEANAPLTLALPLSGQVNNATARVMTNKKTANPYTNGKGPRTPGRLWGSPAQTEALKAAKCPSCPFQEGAGLPTLTHTASETPGLSWCLAPRTHRDGCRHSRTVATSGLMYYSRAPREALG